MFMTNKEESIVGDRLAIAGMNANTIGQSEAPLLLLSIYLLFKPGTKLQKGIHLASAIMLLAVILGTGSRGALLMVLLGSYFIIKPVLKELHGRIHGAPHSNSRFTNVWSHGH